MLIKIIKTHRNSHLDGSLHSKSNLTSSSIHSSNTSIASACSTLTQGGTYRKKKPAPPPPSTPTRATPKSVINTSTPSPVSLQNSASFLLFCFIHWQIKKKKKYKSKNYSITIEPLQSLSPRSTPRTRKLKPAPPPPYVATSTPIRPTSSLSLDVSNVQQIKLSSIPSTTLLLPIESQNVQEPSRKNVWSEEKLNKDEANRNTQILSNTDGSAYLDYPESHDKSLDGKWKRKKGPAPPLPRPLRRKVSFLLSLKKKLFWNIYKT